MTKEELADVAELTRLPAFQRVLARIVIASGLLQSHNGLPAERLVAAEGRRSLAAEILGWVEEAGRQSHPSGIPVSTSIQLLSAIAHECTVKEAKRGRRDGFDRFGDGGDGSADE